MFDEAQRQKVINVERWETHLLPRGEGRAAGSGRESERSQVDTVRHLRKKGMISTDEGRRRCPFVMPPYISSPPSLPPSPTVRPAFDSESVM